VPGAAEDGAREEEEEGMCVRLVCVVSAGEGDMEVREGDTMDGVGGMEERAGRMMGRDVVVRACARSQELRGLYSLLCSD
jgi:hypothetical protein